MVTEKKRVRRRKYANFPTILSLLLLMTMALLMTWYDRGAGEIDWKQYNLAFCGRELDKEPNSGSILFQNKKVDPISLNQYVLRNSQERNAFRYEEVWDQKEDKQIGVRCSRVQANSKYA
jgi:hypothetical protein